MIPHNQVAQDILLGTMLGACFTGSEQYVVDTWHTYEVQPDWFCGDRILVYQAMKELMDARTPITLPAMLHKLSRLDQPASLIQLLIDQGEVMASVGTYARMLSENAVKRRIQQRLYEFEEQLLDPNSTAAELFPTLAGELSEAMNKGVPEAQEGMIETADRISSMFVPRSDQQDGIYIPTRWNDLQMLTGGGFRGKSRIVAARPGQGKSTFCWNEALWRAIQGYKTACISLEMTRDEVLTVMACDRVGLNMHRLNAQMAEEEEIDLFRRTLAKLSDYPIWVVESSSLGSMTIEQIISTVRRLNRREDLDCVYIDYVQLIRPGPGSKLRRYDMVSEWSAKLAWLAQETGTSVTIACQLSRAAVDGSQGQGSGQGKRPMPTPKLHHLKEAGTLEENAYQVILLYPEEGENPNDPFVRYCVSVDKHRGGPTGSVRLTFAKPRQRFE